MKLPPGAEAVWEALPEARVAGGAVRDFLAARPVADVDFAVPLEPGAVTARLAAAGIRVLPTGVAHGTVTALAEGHGFEITTLRRDVRTDGRHAVVAFTDDWQVDASRRDFTINAMSMDRAGTIYDYFGGRGDLAAGIVRFVGDPRARIAEDFLRILRFFRFFARYGGVCDTPAVAAIAALREGVLRLSAERVWAELKRILIADDPLAAMRLMEETGVLGLVVPEGVDLARLESVVRLAAGSGILLRAAALLARDAAGFAARLKLSHEELGALLAYQAPLGLAPGAADDDIRRALADTPAAILEARAWLAQSRAPADSTGWDDLRHRLRTTARPEFPLRGRDLTDLGIEPGKRVGDILAAVRSWWMAGGCVADKADCASFAKTLMT